MPDKKSKFHEFSLKSILFKGRHDWYVCYLKAERIAHVLALLAATATPAQQRALEMLADRAAALPGDIAHLAAGEVDAPLLLADVFAVMSALRVEVTRGTLAKDNGTLLVEEYERMAERLMAGSHPSPFISADDLSVPMLPESVLPPALEGRSAAAQSPSLTVKDIKGHQGQSARMSLILDYIKSHKKASIKDIASVVRDCSEKTIQRELGALIEQGLVRKVGERRWSVYTLA